MIPYKTIIQTERNKRQPLYLQITNQLMQLIKDGTLRPGTKLPSTRVMSELLEVHRKTIVACYEELDLQGWIISIPKKGTYVNQDIPVLKQQQLSKASESKSSSSPGFTFNVSELNPIPETERNSDWMYINDGISDPRLAPVKEIARVYRSIANRKKALQYTSYGSTYGNPELRKVLVEYLNETRGLKIDYDNIMITRGSQMGIFLSAQLLLSENSTIVVGQTNYVSADITFQKNGAKILRVQVDEHGIDTEQVENLCKKHKISTVYVTSHHHHPTTVTLSAKRRMHLLNLAHKYHFAILEDDYDYDFHYKQSPILPLKSHDLNNNVIYIGSVCKTVAPVYRIGYLIAPKPFIDQCAQNRRFVDRQGDSLLELAFAYYIKEGYLERHIKKVLKLYKSRRDLFCKLLKDELGTYLQFEKPHGGMAIWVRLNKEYSWKDVAFHAQKSHLEIGRWQRYDKSELGHNAIRIGFATYQEEEIREVIKRLKQTFKSIEKCKATSFSPNVSES